MLHCVLRVLRANLRRMQEQLKDADDMCLLYHPLNISEDGTKGGDEGKMGASTSTKDLSHLLVFQLLRSVLQCISGKNRMFFLL